MKILGVDPGLAGAMCVIDVSDDAAPQLVAVLDLPIIGDGAKRRVDVRAIYDWVQTHRPQHAYLEHSSARPGQGVAGIFRYARACGCIETVVALAKIPTTIIAPAKWKGFFGLAGGDKENDRLKALQLIPSAQWLARKKDHQRADAILLALYGEKHAQV